MNNGHHITCNNCYEGFEVDIEVTIKPDYCPYCGEDPDAPRVKDL